MKTAKPYHCKGCLSFHSARRANPKAGLEKYNAWCCAKGAPCKDSIGWCKLHDKKRVKVTHNEKLSGGALAPSEEERGDD